MSKERFAEILKEYGYSDNQINLLWNARPDDNLDEDKLREAAKSLALTKDSLVQA